MENIIQNSMEITPKLSEENGRNGMIKLLQMEYIEPSTMELGDSATFQQEEHLFYNLPKYYDMAFDRDLDKDIEFFQKCFRDYSEVEVYRILEPACGTGMFLENLPKYGYQAIGYDLSEKMVQYSKLRILKRGLNQEQADVFVGDMKNKIFREKFDAAFICINSLGYLKTDPEINAHFKTMAQNLKKGGLYIVEISCKCDDISNEKRKDETWAVNMDGIKLKLTWNPSSYDIVNRIRHVDFEMIINDNGNIIEIKEAHELRLWLYEEFKQFVSNNGFEIIAIYDQNYQKIPSNNPITGELGVLFYVIRNDN